MRSRFAILVLIVSASSSALSLAEPPGPRRWHAPTLSWAVFTSDGQRFVARFDQAPKAVGGHHVFSAVFSVKGERIATLPLVENGVDAILPVLRPGRSEVLLARRRPPSFSTRSEELFLWDYQLSKEVRIFKPSTSHVGSLAFSPDGKVVLSGHWDKRILAWDADNGKFVRSFDLPRKPFEKLSTDHIAEFFFLPGGKLVAAGFNDSVSLWETSAGKKAQPELKGYDKAQQSSRHTLAAISQDGRYACTSKPALDWTGDRLRLWDLKTGKLVRSFNLPDKEAFAAACSFADKGKSLLVLGGSGRLHTFDVVTGKHLKQWPVVEKKPVWGAAFSPDGMRLLTAGETTTMILWDTRTGKAVQDFGVPPEQ
jgi:WD40 repeat protein